MRTPRWLGFLIQRPESHTVHHARGLHAYNYSDLPLFDLVFGTFRNPPTFEHENGLHHGASSRVWEMLSFRDVSEAPGEAASPSRGPSSPRRGRQSILSIVYAGARDFCDAQLIGTCG